MARKAIVAVAEAQSRESVKALGLQYPLLQKHLSGESYTGNQQLVVPVRRRSGRSGWAAWRGSALPDSSRWPQGAWNWDSMASWRQ